MSRDVCLLWVHTSTSTCVGYIRTFVAYWDTCLYSFVAVFVCPHPTSVWLRCCSEKGFVLWCWECGRKGRKACSIRVSETGNTGQQKRETKECTRVVLIGFKPLLWKSVSSCTYSEWLYKNKNKNKNEESVKPHSTPVNEMQWKRNEMKKTTNYRHHWSIACLQQHIRENTHSLH